MRKTGLSRASWYNDMRQIMTDLTPAQAKMLRRRNSSISRAHRLYEGLKANEPSPNNLREAMMNMAHIVKHGPDHLREGAERVYDECLAELKHIDLGR